MKKLNEMLGVVGILIALSGHLAAQNDSKATLQWVERQAGRIDLLLEDAIQGQAHVGLVINMLEAYRLFDAVSLAGVYCVEVRKAALEGRQLTDVVHHYLGKDMIAGVQRASNARLAAEKMRLAALACQLEQRNSQANTAFTPADVIREDAVMVKLLLEDGLAAEDMHILSQKMVYVIRLLEDMQTLAASLDQCEEAQKQAQWALEGAEAVLYVAHWPDARDLVQEVLAAVQKLSTSSCE